MDVVLVFAGDVPHRVAASDIYSAGREHGPEIGLERVSTVVTGYQGISRVDSQRFILRAHL
jgi:hypothetical protein